MESTLERLNSILILTLTKLNFDPQLEFMIIMQLLQNKNFY